MDAESEDEHAEGLVERQSDARREEDERQGDDDARQSVARVAHPLNERTEPPTAANREQGDDQRAGGADGRREQPGQQRVAGVLRDRRELDARGEPLLRPVDEHADGQRERQRDDQGAAGQRRPAPAAEVDDPRLARRSRADPVVGAAPPRAAVEVEHADGEQDEQRAERGRRRAVERRAVGDVDRAGKRVEAHQRHRPEVAQHVEGDEQRACADRRVELGQDDRAQDRRRRPAERARGLLELRVEPGERAAHRDQDEGIGEERQHEPGAREPVDRRDPVDAERLEQPLQRALRPERRDEEVGADVARDHQRQRRQHGPDPPPRQVRARRQPGQREGDRDRADGHRRGERRAADRQLQRLRAPDRIPGGRGVVEHRDDQVQRGQRRRAGDQQARDVDRPRQAAHAGSGCQQPRPQGPCIGARCRGTGYSAPVSCRSSSVPSRSVRSERSIPGSGI